MNKTYGSRAVIFAAVLAMIVAGGCAKRVQTAQESAGVGEGQNGTAESGVGTDQGPKIQDTVIGEQGQGITSTPAPGMQDAYFDYDRYDIRPDAKVALQADAKTLKANPRMKVKIEGHCDERGTAEYNLALGERRAQSAKRFLTALGIPGARMSTISYGKERQVCMEASEDCYQRNRRVHFSDK
jgi:peptidoglycan-associated lipoprotein